MSQSVSLVKYCHFGPKLILKIALRPKTNFITNVYGTIHSFESIPAQFSSFQFG